jgi:hypothetical protein
MATAWSIFTQGGGQGAALTWAIDLLKGIKAPLTPGNEQFVYDWEVSEGGGGAYNPLNIGTVTGDPSLTTSGDQFGGGSANYAGWSQGLTGTEDYLGYPNFKAIADDLRANDPTQARADLIASPWASSHYDNGSGFSDAPAPGTAAALPPVGSTSSSSSKNSQGGITGVLSSIETDFKTYAVVIPAVIMGGALAVWGAVKMTGAKQPVKQAAQAAAHTAEIGALA